MHNRSIQSFPIDVVPLPCFIAIFLIVSLINLNLLIAHVSGIKFIQTQLNRDGRFGYILSELSQSLVFILGSVGGFDDCSTWDVYSL